MSKETTILTMQMSRQQAKKLGLLTCQTCGWPENNHFDRGVMDDFYNPSAHDGRCKKFVEGGVKGVTLVG